MISADINTLPFNKIDIEAVRGDTKKIVLVVMDGETQVDVSLWQDFYLTVDRSRTPATTSTQVVQLIGVVEEPETDLYQVEFTPDGTIEAGNYYFDIQATDADGAITTLVMGKYKLHQDITKD